MIINHGPHIQDTKRIPEDTCNPSLDFLMSISFNMLECFNMLFLVNFVLRGNGVYVCVSDVIKNIAVIFLFDFARC